MWSPAALPLLMRQGALAAEPASGFSPAQQHLVDEALRCLRAVQHLSCAPRRTDRCGALSERWGAALTARSAQLAGSVAALTCHGVWLWWRLGPVPTLELRFLRVGP